MINNRLFNKINSLFWGILSWLPLFISIFYVFCYSISIDISDITNFTFVDFVDQISNFTMQSLPMFNNYLYTIFFSFLDIFGIAGEQPICLFALVVLSWFCMVQVFRLLSYVFVWFIDLIFGLFDLMTFNRKGDN